jgi:predicted RNA-binding Zn ribbon-like protein
MDEYELLKSDRWDYGSGHRSLDFANTRDWHLTEQPKDRLRSYVDFTDWAEQGRVISAAQKRVLDAEASAHPRQAEKVLADVRHFRDALQRVFDAQATNAKANPADLELIKSHYSQATARANLEVRGDEVTLRWPEISRDLEYPLSEIAWVSMGLLLSDKRKMVGQCADDRGCGFLFLDTSKNHSRRWCSMEGCGNRAKAKRHYKAKSKA